MLRLRRYLPRVGRWPRLLLAGCCALLALASAAGGGRPAAGPPAHTVAVVVAARELPAGHRLTRSDLLVEHWPEQLRPAAARGDPSTLAGLRLAGLVSKGEPITATRLIGADLASALPRGLVAAALTLADEHASELVRPGDRVDLLETQRPVDPLAGGPTEQTEVAALAARVSVLAVLPATAAADAELVVAVDRRTAVRITRDTATHVFTAVVVPP